MIKEGYTRVSSLISFLHDFGGVDNEILLKKMEIGNITHDAIEKYLRKEKTLNEIASINDYLEAFSMLVREKRIKYENIKVVEKRYYDDIYKITGKVDCIMQYNGKTILVDWKTSSKIHKAPYSVQLCIYKLLVEDFEIDAMYVVQLCKGFYNIMRVDEKKYIELAESILNNHFMKLQADI